MPKAEKFLTTVKEEQDRYLLCRQQVGTFVAACKKAKISPNTVYGWREVDQETGYTAKEFCRLELEARDFYKQTLEEEADRRGKNGVLRPVYQGGKRVGSIREFSDNLLMFRLKALDPEKYKDRVAAEHSGPKGGPIQHAHHHRFAGMTDEELEAFIRDDESTD